MFNTEHRKCHREEDETELGHLEISEDRMIELLHGNKVCKQLYITCASYMAQQQVN